MTLVDFYAYSCINCQRSVPGIERLYETYRDAGLQVIGVHSPEYAFERDVDNVRSGSEVLGITYPVAVDSELATWQSFDNHYWPAHYLAAAAAVLVLAGIGIGRWTSMDSMAPTEHYAHLNQAQDVQRVTDTMPDGHIATLTWSQDMSMTALSLPEEMMAASQGHSLQVWLVKGGVVTSLGLYDPDKGTGFTFLDLMPEDGERILITQEPVGGSAQPTGDPLVTIDVNADGTTTRRPVTPATPTAAPQA